ncbi:hypothetical protein TorRG33x02_268690 [Trema orientale]|uniref:Transmembrane protein n=1 Tax=Trema orientale TaxID=63057 RepID=A0A2P5CYR7_TREOI|nr:hypothetical protein TorRG33x02_268690 [Trema orientale]
MGGGGEWSSQFLFYLPVLSFTGVFVFLGQDQERGTRSAANERKEKLQSHVYGELSILLLLFQGSIGLF